MESSHNYSINCVVRHDHSCVNAIVPALVTYACYSYNYACSSSRSSRPYFFEDNSIFQEWFYLMTQVMGVFATSQAAYAVLHTLGTAL